MEFVKGKPFFCDVKQKIHSFLYLDKNIECDVLVIGGGISGAITNYYFAESVINTVLIEKERLGYKSTPCATALLEYQLDDFASDLKSEFSEKEIVDIYKMGIKSLDILNTTIKKIGNKCFYSKRDTLLFTKKQSDVNDILTEYNFRKAKGFDVEYIDEKNNPFNFEIKAGLIAKNGGAEFNPYLFEKQLIDEIIKHKNYNIYEHSSAKEIIKIGDKFKVITNYGVEIICNKIIASTGYNSALFTDKKLCDKFVSYSIVTSKVKKLVWKNRMLIQNTLVPYHYIRLTSDSRILVGGEDTKFKNDVINDKTSEKKYKALLKFLEEMFPDNKGKFIIDYKYCGAFASTKNNLSVIGESDTKNLWFNYCYGANGIVNCIFASQMLLDLYHNKQNRFYKYFSPKRELV